MRVKLVRDSGHLEGFMPPERGRGARGWASRPCLSVGPGGRAALRAPLRRQS